MVIKPMVQDKDLIFKGNDSGSTITALTLDMSNAGAARFNGSIIIEKNARVLEIADAAIQWYSAETSDYKSALFRADDYSFKNAGNSVVATISSTGAITSSGAISGTNGTFSGSLALSADSSQLQLGTGNRAQIFHNSAALYLRSSTGGVIVQGPSLSHYSSDATTLYFSAASGGLSFGGTNFLNSSRKLQNVTLGEGTTGARWQANAWHYDNSGMPRFYFEGSGRIFYRGETGHHFRANGDTTRLTISQSGGINLFSAGDTQAGTGEVINVAGTNILDSSRNLTNLGTISSGAITSTASSSTFTNTSTMDINLVANPPELNFEDTSSTSGTKRARWTLDSNNFTAQGLADNDGSVTQELLNFSLSSGAATFGGTISSGEMSATNYKVGTTQIVTSGRSIQNIVNYTGSGEIQISGNLQATHVYNSGSYHVLNAAGNGWNTIVNRGTGDNFTVNAAGGYQMAGTTVIDSSRNLTNIGTISASGLLRINDENILLAETGNNERSIRIQNSTVTAYFGIEGSSANRFVGSGANNMFLGTTTADGIEFATNNTVRATINSDGYVLIGKTNTTFSNAGIELRSGNLGARFIRNFAEPIFVNRTGNDGNIIKIYCQTTEVGNIGSQGTRPYFGNAINFSIKPDDANSGSLVPANQNGVPNDNVADIGLSSNRWNDLYLGGGVYLGGTGSANHLDDYEEGTWTPTVASDAQPGGYTYQVGYYTKIGRTVHVTAQFKISSISNFTGATININGLPFTIANVTTYDPTGIVVIKDAAVAKSGLYSRGIANTTYARIEQGNGNTSSDMNCNANVFDTDTICYFDLTYFTTS